MSSRRELYNALLAVKNDKKSGKIYVYGREKNLLRSGIITVNDGQLSSINYLQESPNTAFYALLSLDLTKVVFLPYTSVGDHKKDSDLLDISTALNKLETDSRQEDKSATFQNKLSTPEALQLRQEVQLLLEKFYGSGVFKRVDEIALHLPPHEKPKEFLDKCKELVVIMLGQAKAEKMFETLYGKVA